MPNKPIKTPIGDFTPLDDISNLEGFTVMAQGHKVETPDYRRPTINEFFEDTLSDEQLQEANEEYDKIKKEVRETLTLKFRFCTDLSSWYLIPTPYIAKMGCYDTHAFMVGIEWLCFDT